MHVGGPGHEQIKANMKDRRDAQSRGQVCEHVACGGREGAHPHVTYGDEGTCEHEARGGAARGGAHEHLAAPLATICHV